MTAYKIEKGMMFAWMPKQVIGIVEALIEKQGVSKSEYLRQLILTDLDKRSVFTTQLKAELFPIPIQNQKATSKGT